MSGSSGRVACDAGLRLRALLAHDGPAGVAEGREPAAHGLVQDPRRVEQARHAGRRRASSRRGRCERGEPRPGGCLRRARARRQGDDVHAAGRADGEGRGDAGRTVPRPSLPGPASTRRWPRRSSARARRARRSCTRSRTSAVIAGQGTIGLELAEQLPDVGTFLVPVGGGGLASGVAIALRAQRPAVRIVGVQVGRHGPDDRRRDRRQAPERAPAAHPRRSARRSRRRLGRRDHRRDHAAARARQAGRRGRRGGGGGRAPRRARPAATGGVCAVLSGGNIDPTTLISVMRHGLALAGRYLDRADADRRPSRRARRAAPARRCRARQRLSVGHHREGTDVHIAQTGVELTVITRNEEHCARLCSALEGRGYVLDRLA